MEPLSEPWQATAYYLTNEVPFLSRALSILTLGANPELKDSSGKAIMAGVTKHGITVNDPEIRMYEEQVKAAGLPWFETDALMRVFVLTHECLHVVLETMSRVGQRDFPLWNVATDYINNAIFLEIMAQPPFNLPNHRLQNIREVLAACFFYDPKYVGMSADEVYEELVKQNPPEPKSKQLTGRYFLEGDSGNGEATELPKDLQDLVVQNIEDTRKQLSPGSMRTAMAELGVVNTKPPISFKDIIHKIRDTENDGLWSYRVPSRDSVWAAGLGLMFRPPSYVTEESPMIREIVFAIDVSGSIGEREIQSAMAIFKDAFKHTKRPIRLLCLTTEVVFETMASDGAAVVKVPRWGGTRLSCMIKHLKDKKIVPSLVVLVTDGLDDPNSKAQFSKWEHLNKLRTVLLDKTRRITFPGLTFTVDSI